MVINKVEARRRVVSVVEAAQALAVSEKTVRRLVATGALGSVRAGSRVLVPVAALDEYTRTGTDQPKVSA